ncbi:MAG: radical SAM protein, partial [Candidatus Delongbacteria bacterium]|nr:radical SAM protein [Candidatus Delongbacteria bacterium]MCG2760047.1 radical SAM protein [Candidatus Delongbacteria bacterium]
LARGCYWHKCTFCDTTLPYIKDFSMENVNDIINDIKTMTAQTGLNTFYFTDEAIPPAMAVKLSIALIKENIDISWWGNIRFDYAFTEDVCKLLHRAGCIAVVGGLESACNITLNKMNKGIKIEEAVQVMSNFKSNGILVHSYMIYGFPGESRLDLIDSTEVLRQLFAEGLIDSAFWHRFALTRHSGVFKDPAKYNISIPNSDLKPFANNDISYIDNSNENIDDMGDGLRRSVYNFMLGIEIDKDIKTWFEVPVQKPRVKKNFVKDILNNNIFDLRSDRKILWLGFGSKASASGILVINGINGIIEYELPVELSNWLSELFRKSSIFSSDGISIKEAGNSFPKNAGLVFSDFINNEIWDDLKDSGLIII